MNGLPVATCELKNPGTGQSWRHAVRQYQSDRDPRAPLFGFKTRALVHFAADPDEVHMTTRLAGEATHFLPVQPRQPSRAKCSAAPATRSIPPATAPATSGKRCSSATASSTSSATSCSSRRRRRRSTTARAGSGASTKEALIFPRYHQLDAVRRIVDAAGQRRRRATTISSSTRPAAARPTASPGCRIAWPACTTRGDKKVFDCVVVITDRRVLDQQLQDAIYQIEHAQGVVKAIDQDSKQLAAALIDGTQIVITTLQKFPFVLRGLLHAAGAESQEKATERREAAGQGMGGGDC